MEVKAQVCHFLSLLSTLLKMIYLSKKIHQVKTWCDDVSSSSFLVVVYIVGIHGRHTSFLAGLAHMFLDYKNG